MRKSSLSIKQISLIAIMSAIAAVLMVFDFPIVFIAPGFYRIDFSDLPCIIGSFALGPLCGSIMEILKVLIKLLIKPTSTVFAGELSNLLCGLSYVVTAGFIYNKHHNNKGALSSLIISSIVYIIVSLFVNYFITIPFYVSLYGISIEEIIKLGQMIFPFIDSKSTFVISCVLLFNTIKMTAVSLVAFILYKKISSLLKK